MSVSKQTIKNCAKGIHHYIETKPIQCKTPNVFKTKWVCIYCNKELK